MSAADMMSGPRTAHTPLWRAAWFVLLAVACSWVPLFALLATTGDPAASLLSGALWVAGGFGPALAAVIVAAAADGGTGLRRLWHSMTRWRLGRWYLLLLAPLPVAVTAVLLAAALGPAQIDIAGLAQWYVLPAVLVHGALNTWYTATVQWLAPDTIETFMPYAALLITAVAGLLLWRCGATHLSGRRRATWPDLPAGAPA